MRRAFHHREAATLLIILAIVFGARLVSPHFFDPRNLQSILLWLPLLLTVAVGQLMVIFTRGIDVSVGSSLGLTAILVGLLFRDGNFSVGLGLVASVAIGLLLGAINGLLIAGLRVPPIVATLGTLTAFRGLAFIASKGKQIDSNDLPESLSDFALYGPLSIGGVTFSWLLMISIVVALAAHVVLQHTRIGRDFYALGSNPEAARLRGVNTVRANLLPYVITGGLTGLAAVMYASRFGFVNPATAGAGFELTVIAAVVIGGTNVFGGSGNVFGVFLGCLLLAVVNVSLATLGIEANWQLLAYGSIILAAIFSEGLAQSRLRKESP